MLPSKRLICSRSIVWFLFTLGIVEAGKVCADQTFDQTNPNHVWDTTTSNWDNSTHTWLNDGSSNAIFAGAAQTLDVNGGINVNNITFNSNGWNIGDPTADGSLNLGAPSTITVTNVNDTATIGVGLASGSLTKGGLGTLVLSGTNTFTGNVTVGTGTLKITNSSALGDITGTTSVTSGAALVLGNGVNVTGETIGINGSGINSTGALQADAGASATWGGTITIDTQGGRIGAQNGGTLTVSGVIKNGTGNSNGILAIGGAPGAAIPGVVIISGTNNTYSGVTQIVRGVLKLGATNALPATTIVDVSSSTTATEDSVFDLNGFSQSITGLQRTNTVGAGFVTNNGAAASTLTVTGGASPFTGVIKDGTSTVALTKSGTGTLTLTGANTYTGATSVSGGTLSLSGSLTGTAITTSGGTAVGAGALSETSTGVIGGAVTVTIGSGNFIAGGSVTAGATFNGANTYTGLTIVGASGNAGVLVVNNNLGLGTTAAGTTVNSGEVILGNGVTVTGETITINGNGTNNNGALQTTVGTSSTWAGNIIVASAARLGGGDNGTLTVNGVISGGSTLPIVFSRGTNAVTILNAVNTYTGDTQLFANAGAGDVLRIGVDNAINALSRLSMIGALATATMTLDLNGHVLTLRTLDTTAATGGSSLLVVANNTASTTSTLTLSSATNVAADNGIFAGSLQDGTSGTGGLSVVKGGINTQILIGANTYTGSTTINGGTLQIGAAGAGGLNGTLASPNIILNGGIFSVNNAGATNNNTNRLNDNASFSFKGGTYLFTGSELASTPSSEKVHAFALNSGISKITTTFGGTNTAAMTLDQLTRPANGGIALVNGANLGKDGTSTASVARLLVTTAPTLVGTTADTGNGINLGVFNTQIVPFLLGEAASGTGGVGTVTGVANTFVTYSATGGLRPLNLTDEFTLNAFTLGNNIHLTSTISLSGSVAINSLIIEGTNTAPTISSGQTLTVTSGAILFSSGTNLGITGGTLDFGGNEGIITINATPNTTIGSVITGTAGVSYYGTGTLVLQTQQNTYSGNTLLAVGTVIPQGSSIGPAGAPTSGPFGTGTVIFGGSQMRATTTPGGITIGNTISFAADTTIIAAGGSDQPLAFTGPVTLTGNRTLTQNSAANTIFSGNIGDGGNGFGLTVNSPSTGTIAPVILSGNSTYSGTTAVKGTVVVSGSLSGSSAVVIGDSTSLSKTTVLGGGGTVGNVTVGIAAGNTGAALKPHAGSASTNAGTTLHAGSVTFANSSVHLSLQIGRTSAFTGSGGDGASGGDVSDHLGTTGALTLNGADLQLSLLTTTGYTPVNGDIFFLTINSGGAITGTFSSVNGIATDLGEGMTFSTGALGTQAYQITYLANFAGNSFSGGHDVALLAVVPEPGSLVSLFGGLGCLLGAQRFRRTRRGKTGV
ncbi:MAG: autotransporter-associated beta strand repeat-containing protein [Chthoniobacter sp.]|uniref:beta strand repeat-containing protein n=1 Tax=Chthoniobacter sp. TaxID=2510640 RepID=UPI0032A1C612